MNDNNLDPSIEHDLQRVDAAAGLVMNRCPHCSAVLEVIATRGDLPRAVGITHEPGCPDWLPDWPE